MANVNLRHYFLKLVNTRTKKPLNDDTGDYQVYTAGSPARATIKNATGTTLTQEVVGTSFISRDMTDGTLEFYTDISVSSVDISILTAKGRSYFLKGITQSQHRVDVDPERSDYMLVVGFNDKASSTTVRPLGFQLRKGMLVNDVLVKVTTAFTGAAAASNAYNIGRSGDVDGFLDSLTLSAAGFKQGHPSVSTTGVVTVNRYGADLAQFHASSTGGVDFYVRKSYLAVTGVASNSLAVRRQTAATLTASFTGQTGAGYIYYMYQLLPTEATDTSF